MRKSNLIGTLVTSIGFALITVGVALIALPAGFIVGGAAVAFTGYRMGG